MAEPIPKIRVALSVELDMRSTRSIYFQCAPLLSLSGDFSETDAATVLIDEHSPLLNP